MTGVIFLYGKCMFQRHSSHLYLLLNGKYKNHLYEYFRNYSCKFEEHIRYTILHYLLVRLQEIATLFQGGKHMCDHRHNRHLHFGKAQCNNYDHRGSILTNSLNGVSDMQMAKLQNIIHLMKLLHTNYKQQEQFQI